MTVVKWTVACLVPGVLCGCGLIEPVNLETFQNAAMLIEEAATTFSETADSVGAEGIGDTGEEVAWGAGAVAAALGAVRMWRGGVNARKGEAPQAGTPGP